MFQLRLPALRIEQLRRIAADRGVSPGALAVDWVIERLDQEDTATGPLPIDVDVETAGLARAPSCGSAGRGGSDAGCVSRSDEQHARRAAVGQARASGERAEVDGAASAR